MRSRLGGAVHGEEGPGEQLAKSNRLSVALSHARIAVEQSAERLGGAGKIEAVAPNDAEQHVSPRLPARLLAESLGRPCRRVQRNSAPPAAAAEEVPTDRLVSSLMTASLTHLLIDKQVDFTP